MGLSNLPKKAVNKFQRVLQHAYEKLLDFYFAINSFKPGVPFVGHGQTG